MVGVLPYSSVWRLYADVILLFFSREKIIHKNSPQKQTKNARDTICTVFLWLSFIRGSVYLVKMSTIT